MAVKEDTNRNKIGAPNGVTQERVLTKRCFRRFLTLNRVAKGWEGLS